jgi:hypothetical protein
MNVGSLDVAMDIIILSADTWIKNSQNNTNSRKPNSNANNLQ